MAHEDELPREVIADRARWLVRLHWAGIAVAAIGIAINFAASDGGRWRAVALGSLLVALGAANFFLAARTRARAATVRDIFLSLALDVAALTVALHFTGGIENPFQVYYVFPVILAGIALPRGQSYAIAALAASLFGALGMLEFAKILPHHDVELLPIWRSAGQQAVDQYEDWRYILGSSFVLLSTLLGATYLTTAVAAQVERHRHELALSKERLEGIVRALGEGVAYFDADDALVLANDAFLKLFPAKPRARLLDVAPADVKRPLEEALGSLHAGEPFESFEAKDGERVLACGLSAVRGAGGVAWVVEDVTERRRGEERATMEKRLADLGVLAAGIAHEVLNPLSSISSTADLIESEPGELVVERVRKIRKQVERITLIVRGVAELARPSGARPAPVPLDDVIADAASRAREERPNACALEVDVARPAPTAAVAEEPLRVAVKNLITNAFDAAGPGGHVRVRARQEDGEAVLEVEDDGPGIPDKERIFVPFYTTKSPGAGAGLGLPIVASIVRQHGGKIEVSSASPHGARFTMRLPGRSK